MPKNAAIIGRVAVKVLPDTDSFKEDAQAQLNKIEKQLRNLEVTVIPKLDENGIVQQAKALQARIEREMKDITLKVNVEDPGSIKSALNQINSQLTDMDAIKIPVNLDKDELKAMRDMLQADLDALTQRANITLRVNEFDQDSLRGALQKIESELKNLDAIDLEVELDRESLEAAKAMLTEQLDKVAHITLEFNLDNIASLEGELAKVNAEIQKMDSIQLEVGMNRGDLEAAKALLQEQIAELNKQAKIEIDIKTKLDEAANQLIVNRVTAALNEVRFAPGLDGAKIAETKRQIETVLYSIEALQQKVTVTMDPLAKRQLQLEMDALQAELDTLTAKAKLKVDNEASFMLKMAELTRDRTVSIVADLSQASVVKVGAALAMLSGARILQMKFEGIAEMIGQADTLAISLATAATKLGAFAAVGVAASGQILALGSSLASIAPAALALPGIFGGFAVGIGATVAAFKDFNKYVPEAKGYMSELQNLISTNFWSEQQGYINKFLSGAMVPLRSGLAETGKQLGGFFGNLAFGLMQNLTPRLPGMFDALNSSINIAIGSTGALSQIIGILGSVGASYLPRLAQWFVDITNSFAGWLQKNEDNGQIFSWIDTGIAALSALGSVIKNVATILAGLASAAVEAGGGGLGSLAASLAHVSDVVNSDEFQTGLVATFQAAYAAIANFTNFAGPAIGTFVQNFGTAFQAIAPLIGSTLGVLVRDIATALSDPAIAGALTSFFESIRTVADQLTPIWGPLGQGIAAILPVLGSLLTAIAPLIAATANTLMPILDAILPPIQTLIGILSTGLLAAIEVLEPVVVGLVQAFAGLLTGGGLDMIASVMQSLMPVLSAVGGAVLTLGTALINSLIPLMPIISAAFATLGPPIAAIVTMLAEKLAPIFPVLASVIGIVISTLAPWIAQLIGLATAVLGPVIDMIMQLAEEYLPKLAEVWASVVTALTPFVAMLTSIAQVVMPVLMAVLGFLIDMLLGALIGAINGVVGIISGALDIIMGVWNIFAGVFTLDWGRVWDGIKQVFQGIFEAIWGFIQLVWNVWILATFLSGMGAIKGVWEAGWGAVKAFFESIFGGVKGKIDEIWGLIKAIWEGGVNGIRDLWKNVWDTIKTIVEGIWPTIQGFIKTLWDGIKSFFSDGVAGMKSKVSEGIDNVVQFFKDLPGKVLDAVSSLLEDLKSFGGNLLSGLWEGISGKTQWLLDKVGGFFGSLLPGWVKDMLGIHSPSKVFAEIGQWLPMGLAEGMVDTAALATVKGAAQTMADHAVDGLDLFDSGRLVTDSLLNGMESKYDAIKDSLSGLGDDISKTEIAAPSVSMAKQVGSLAASSYDANLAASGAKVLIYNAAPGSSVDSEEDLFRAANRARMGW